MSDPVWYIFENGEQSGPFSQADLRMFLSQGSITNAAMVWRDGLAEWISIGKIVPPQIRAPQAPAPPDPIDYYIKKAVKAKGFFVKYKQRVGLRSFIFQCIFAGWTTAAIALWISFNISALGSAAKRSYYPVGSEERTAEDAGKALGVGAGWCCVFGGWAVIGIPVGIAALATLENKK